MGTSIADGVVELNAMTKAYYEADGGKAWDTLHNVSYAVNYFDKQRKGLFKVVKGGNAFEFPIVIDKVYSGAYNRASATISRIDTAVSTGIMTNQVASSAKFGIRHLLSSVKMLRLDVIQNAGAQQLASVLKTRLEAAMSAHGEKFAEMLYAARDASDNPAPWYGIRACAYAGNPSVCAETSDYYGAVAHDATYWPGKSTNAANAPISLAMLRTARQTSKFKDGKGGRPDFITMKEDLFASIQDIAGTLIRLEGDKDAAKFGFTAVVHEGAVIAADDFAPSGVVCLFNTEKWGCRFLEGGHHDKTDFHVIDLSPGDYYMDIYANGNWVTPSRKAHGIITSVVA